MRVFCFLHHPFFLVIVMKNELELLQGDGQAVKAFGRSGERVNKYILTFSDTKRNYIPTKAVWEQGK